MNLINERVFSAFSAQCPVMLYRCRIQKRNLKTRKTKVKQQVQEKAGKMIDFHALPVFSRPCVTYFLYRTVRTGNYGKTGSTVLFPVPRPPLIVFKVKAKNGTAEDEAFSREIERDNGVEWRQ